MVNELENIVCNDQLESSSLFMLQVFVNVLLFCKTAAN